MKTLATIILYGLAASVLLALVYAAKSIRLRNRFRRLGALQGRSIEEVLKFAGPPNHRVRLAPDREVLEWRRVGFHIALAFTNGVCDGVTYVEGQS
jgi:hypothetical protein